MKKKILYFIIPLFLFFSGISTVFADNCSTVKTKIDSYNLYKDTLSTYDCTDDSDVNNVATCNELNVKKNIVVTELMKLNDENNICSTYKSQVDTIIKENEDKCGKIFNSDFNKFVNNVMALFYIAGPILLILFGSLDYAKATVSSERDAFKKANKNFAKRLAATILLFVAPAITNFIISFNVSDKYLSGNAYTCNYDYIVFNKKYNIVYTPRNNNSTTLRRNSNSNYIWAVGSTHTKVGSVFGPRKPDYPKASKNHNGIDFGVNSNDNVYAIADGVIVQATYDSGMGNYVVLQVEESNGTTMQYYFMHNNSLLVERGDTVTQGTVIARAGSTGSSTGTHCHLRAYNVTTGLYVNPLLYIYGGLNNISAINETTHQIEKVNINATMDPGSWSYKAGTKWDSYYDCVDSSCSAYNKGKKYY